MWDGYLATRETAEAPLTTYMTWHFADEPEAANRLGELAREGIKTATCTLQWTHEANEEEPPQPGDHSIITDWSGRPLCIIETTAVQVVPFEQVSADHASAEGEGDRSLEYWRRAHWEVFSAECASLGKQPSPDMPLICERFRVVYPPLKPGTGGRALAGEEQATD